MIGHHCYTNVAHKDPDLAHAPQLMREHQSIKWRPAHATQESWTRVRLVAAGGDSSLALRKIKECPRCTVPCRDGMSGGWVFPEQKLRLWSVLKKAFPLKAIDPEWGTWAGPFFGVYFGHGGVFFFLFF